MRDGWQGWQRRSQSRDFYNSWMVGVIWLGIWTLRSRGTYIDITSGSGGAGMNLTTGFKLIQYEVWWDGNDEEQAYCRLSYHLQKGEPY